MSSLKPHHWALEIYSNQANHDAYPRLLYLILRDDLNWTCYIYILVISANVSHWPKIQKNIMED